MVFSVGINEEVFSDVNKAVHLEMALFSMFLFLAPKLCLQAIK